MVEIESKKYLGHLQSHNPKAELQEFLVVLDIFLSSCFTSTFDRQFAHEANPRSPLYSHSCPHLHFMFTIKEVEEEEVYKCFVLSIYSRLYFI